jgi:hypothetical protein
MPHQLRQWPNTAILPRPCVPTRAHWQPNPLAVVQLQLPPSRPLQVQSRTGPGGRTGAILVNWLTRPPRSDLRNATRWRRVARAHCGHRPDRTPVLAREWGNLPRAHAEPRTVWCLYGRCAARCGTRPIWAETRPAREHDSECPHLGKGVRRTCPIQGRPDSETARLARRHTAPTLGGPAD